MRPFGVIVAAMTVAVLGMLGFLGYAIYDKATQPSTGVVTARDHQAEFVTVQCTTIGNVTSCIPFTHPECWEVTYYNEGAHRTGSECVSRDDYEHRYPVGAPFPEGVAR